MKLSWNLEVHVSLGFLNHIFVRLGTKFTIEYISTITSQVAASLTKKQLLKQNLKCNELDFIYNV